MSANVETMFYVRKAPWHGLGTRVETALNSKEALPASGLDWKVIQKDIMTSAYKPIPGYKANVRDTDNKVLGVVTDRYKVVQNEEAFAFTDALLGEGVKYETAGSLQDGKKIWILAKLPDKYIIEGEQIDPYLVFSSSHDGSGSIKVAMTPVRVVCQNTLEPFVKSEFTKRTGIEVNVRKELLQSEEYPFMLANLDGTCEHPNLGTCVFEAKTASAYKENEWNDAVQDEYLLQIQHYMAVTGYKGAYIAVLIGGNTFKWKFVERDEELISMIISLESDFWEHVKSETPPALDGTEACGKFLAEKYPSSVPKSQIELSEKAQEFIEQYRTACEQIDALTEKSSLRKISLKKCWAITKLALREMQLSLGKVYRRNVLTAKLLKRNTPRFTQSMLIKYLIATFL